MIERLRHYFSTYKVLPGEESTVFIGEAYGREHAEKVIELSILDYKDKFADFDAIS
jgi:inorganic pyrophosphatase